MPRLGAVVTSVVTQVGGDCVSGEFSVVAETVAVSRPCSGSCDGEVGRLLAVKGGSTAVHNVGQSPDVPMVVLCEEADCSWEMSEEQHGKESALLLAGVDQLHQLRQQLRWAAVTKPLAGKKAAWLFEML